MMASSGVTALLPPVKSVVVYKNGDPFFSGRRFIVNQRQVSTMESFLNDVTLSIGAPLAVRTLYTPRHGHRVHDLEHLQQGAQYVAAGFERFKKLDYQNLGMKRTPAARIGDVMQAKGLNRPNVSAKWRKVVTLPCIIHVFRNGNVLSPAMRFIIPQSVLKNLEQILSLVSEKAMLRTGAVRRLCTLDGVTVTSAEELESGQFYVAVGAERFKKLPYVELLLNKVPGGSADRHCVADRGLHKSSENRKFPHDSNSDSALLHSPERDGRRVKSTGDEAELEGANLSQPLQRRREGGGERDQSSSFYAKPVRVRKHRPPYRAPPRNADQASVFKGISRKREEVRGAEEVAEDESTAVELPVDQRVAEVVQDEEPEQSKPEPTTNMHQTGAPDEHMITSTYSSLSPSDRERSVTEDGPSDLETQLLRRRSSSPNGGVEVKDEDILRNDLEQERGRDEKNGHPQEVDEPDTQEHTRPPSPSSQQGE